jgi:hypothetical protein
VKTKLEVPDNRINMLYGTVVGAIFEAFYTDRIWLRSGVEAILLALVDDILNQTIDREQQKGGRFDWKDKKANYKSIADLRADIVAAIPRGIAIIRYHRLLGRESAAEVKLDTWVDGHILGGRADFIMRRVKPHEDLVILDGKGSRWREQYVDPQQLWWYALLYHLKNKVLPDRLGFVFWRQEPERSLDWVDFDLAALNDLKAGALSAIEHIELAKSAFAFQNNESERTGVIQRDFSVQPSRECKFCEFRPACTEGEKFVSSRFSASDHTFVGVEDVGL